jgi:hypothetical protein
MKSGAFLFSSEDIIPPKKKSFPAYTIYRAAIYRLLDKLLRSAGWVEHLGNIPVGHAENIGSRPYAKFATYADVLIDDWCSRHGLPTYLFKR